MSASRNYSPQAFHPGEIDLLGRVFEQLLEERQVPNCGDQAEALAARLISIYQSGERRIEILKKLTLHPDAGVANDRPERIAAVRSIRGKTACRPASRCPVAAGAG